MKRRIFAVLVITLLMSCQKDDNEKIPANPAWLTAKITEMDNGGYFKGTVVYLYKWQNAYYYLYSIPLSSCMICDFYDYQGLKYEWTPDKANDFQKNAKKIKIIWSEKGK